MKSQLNQDQQKQLDQQKQILTEEQKQLGPDQQQNQLYQQKQILTEEQKQLGPDQQKYIQKDATFDQRLGVLNLEKDPKNPEGTKTQSLVNGINAIPIISNLFALNGNWYARKQNMEKQTAILEPLAETGELLKKIEDKCKLKDGNLDKEKFAKSAVNILSNDNNHDLLEEYLKGEGKKLSEEEITKAIKDVNKAKHILLTGEGYEDFKPKNTKLEEKNKEFIEFLGYKTKAELELMGPKETNDCVKILEKDFGFTLGDKGGIKYEKPKTQSKNYRNELESANNINKKLLEEERENYSKQNTESEEQKTKEKAENKTYSRTPTNTPQSGMSAKNMAGNVAVLGGAIASAAVIPFVGWIVALAILYSFKDKFKDDPQAEKELYENVAKGLEKEGGQTPEKAQETIANLQNKVAQLKERELKKATTPQDDIIKDLGKYLGENPDSINQINQIANILSQENKDYKKELENFLVKEVYKGNPTDEQKKGIENLINSDNINKTVDEVINNIKNNQKNVVPGNENNTQQNQKIIQVRN